MKVMRGVKQWRGGPLCLALGVFDGVHQGHRKVIAATVAWARKRHFTPAVLTFDPHPSAVLNPQGAPPLLTTTDEKLQLLERLEVELTVLAEFNQAFANTSAQQFVEEILVKNLHAQCIIVGERWRFGAGGLGTPTLLRKMSREYGFGVTMVPPVLENSRKISSTRIRELLLGGQIQKANQLLGRPYSLEGVVVPGDGIGTKLGFPTANLKLAPEKLVPADGIYACWAGIKKKRPAVTYIGSRPTFNPSTEKRIEVHLLEFDGRKSLLTRKLKTQFVTRLRADKRFASTEALVRQISQDCREAWKVLIANP